MKTLGICFGATTIQYVIVTVKGQQKTVLKTCRMAHEGDPREAIISILEENKGEIDRVAVTGRAFRSNVELSNISEPEAVECALKEVYSSTDYPNLVISSGGETQLVYTLNPKGGISSVHSGNKCASGTGEFFLQQIRRMGLTLEQAVELAKEGTAHKIAGRCSVFCKSDCTHALNKGEPRANVAAGLCLMMADKICELVKDMESDKVSLIGGGSLNEAMVEILKTRFNSLHVSEFASVFEAYGAALWAVENECVTLPEDLTSVVHDTKTSFGRHPSLSNATDLVEFKQIIKDKANPADLCILGLDVGSTTTKAVLMRKEDKAVVASVYLRTNGDPIQASRNCYAAIKEQLKGTEVKISGLGVTGSGRQIAALHALSDSVINEIIAHATAASYFDKDVDTIFEIGGQDAKYTFLTGGVPSDYAMNEACSAGTGSFLEESARESLNVKTEEIGERAIKGQSPPNFTDQCSAFISSDIKLAGQEGIEKNDILAGLVYSVCMNYVNRVKGSRPIGKKIFMQGGVCYNKSVPIAMASLMQHRIIVPPEPGLMGAFGVALETSNRIDLNLIPEAEFSLEELINREATRDGSFICAGGQEKCDRKCEISKILINGKKYPFGGVCNKYYNLRLNRKVEVKELDYVAIRNDLMFNKYGVMDKAEPIDEDKPARTVGIMRTFLTNAYFPLYSNFFHQMGFRVIFSDQIDPEGLSRIEAAFCLPAELTHGSFMNLLKKSPDYIFLPHVAQLMVPKAPTYSKACVFVQGEPYYLKATFRRELEQSTSVVLSPVLRMDGTYDRSKNTLVEMAVAMGISEEDAKRAFDFACKKQREFDNELQEYGKKALKYLDENPDQFAIVIFGRPYNSFASDANMGIPHKVASRGYIVLPFDMLPAHDYSVDSKMFWGMGQKLMKVAKFVRDRDNLFGFFITNFSCGPDSFLLNFFRNIMKTKPSLTLELDQHTADAGIDTRVEAALDIMESYRKIGAQKKEDDSFVRAKVLYGKEIRVVGSDGTSYPLAHPKVEVLMPSMGRYGTEAAAAVLRNIGVNARALPVADKDVLLTGKKNTSCKECLPYIVTTGSFLDYLDKHRDRDKITLFFMATGGGPCRLGQYFRAFEQLIDNNKLRDVAMFTMTDENGYGGLGTRLLLKAWQGILISDILADIRSMLSVAAVNKENALQELEECWAELIKYFEGSVSTRLTVLLSNIAERLKTIPLKMDPSQIPVVSLVGEIFVRRDEFSRKNIVDYLEERGFMVRVAPIAEFMQYSNYIVNSKLGEREFEFFEMFRMKLTSQIQEWWERKIKTVLAESGLYHFEMIEVEKTIKSALHLMNVNFRGEAILTVGLSLREILNHSCGVISIGPFGCMPSRVAEAILKKEMNVTGKARVPGWEDKALEFSELGEFPFLSIETDGSPFPQLVEANMEAFVLQARRVHSYIQKLSKKEKTTQGFSMKGLSIKIFDLVTENSFELLTKRKS
ncbi:acyl-CoA dehydratase activase [Chitinispirillales bacterium ANBcel5]|uniref:acyl-CoA dehydratase activase n=1 Tax=Cellulosispirillum alkaliphilum TaxID=3039283 RepID=UPI002A4F3050|nr:acyl-CoA dehydratase activase [Chitinispirillales bacterium ANBcel5]